jgi:hypothetical protein
VFISDRGIAKLCTTDQKFKTSESMSQYFEAGKLVTPKHMRQAVKTLNQLMPEWLQDAHIQAVYADIDRLCAVYEIDKTKLAQQLRPNGEATPEDWACLFIQQLGPFKTFGDLRRDVRNDERFRGSALEAFFTEHDHHFTASIANKATGVH